MIVTNDTTLNREVRLIYQYGWEQRFVSSVFGMNSRLDEIQAAILRAKLPFLDAQNDARRSIANTYSHLLASTGLVLPVERPEGHHVYHQYVVRVKERSALQAHLAALGIVTAVHYPMPIHRQPAFAQSRTHLRELATTDALTDGILSLPMFPAYT